MRRYGVGRDVQMACCGSDWVRFIMVRFCGDSDREEVIIVFRVSELGQEERGIDEDKSKRVGGRGVFVRGGIIGVYVYGLGFVFFVFLCFL